MKLILQYLSPLLFLLPLSAAALDSDWQYEDVDRVVAVSDVHGAYDAMVETLDNAGVLDEKLDWAGDSTHLVIVGDILDRGPGSRAVMDLLMKLEPQAADAGGKVHVLIGNHEAMNLTGDLRYVAAEEYAAFAEDETPEQRAHWQRIYTTRAEASRRALEKDEFDRRFPAGFFAHRDAFRADGRYGQWLLSKPVMVVINRIAYVHGGVSPLMSQYSLEAVNGNMVRGLGHYVRHVATLVDAGILLPSDNFNDHPDIVARYSPALDGSAEVLHAIDELRRLHNSQLFDPDGPLWYRGNVSCSRITEEHRLEKTLAAIGADRVVIGHTPTRGRQIMQRFDGKIIEVDTGMLGSYYAGSGNALVIEDDDLSVVSEDGTYLADPISHPRRVGSRPDTLDADKLEALLYSGEIVGSAEVELQGKNQTVLKISNGEATVEAVFMKQRSRRNKPAIAAYRLDRFLELNMVPVTVERPLGKIQGAVQFLPRKTSNEQARSESGRGGNAWCPLNDQWNAMYVYDALIYNEARTQLHMLYDPENWQLMLTGHDQTFGTKRGLPPYLSAAPVEVTPGWHAKLEVLDALAIDEMFGDVLDNSRRRALLARRNGLLSGSSR